MGATHLGAPGGGAPWWVVPTQVPPPVVLGSKNSLLLYKKSSQSFIPIRELLFLYKNNIMVVLLKTSSVWVSFIQIMQIRVQNKRKSIRKSRYVGDVSRWSCAGNGEASCRSVVELQGVAGGAEKRWSGAAKRHGGAAQSGAALCRRRWTVGLAEES